jgi:hypothetical protein
MLCLPLQVAHEPGSKAPVAGGGAFCMSPKLMLLLPNFKSILNLQICRCRLRMSQAAKHQRVEEAAKPDVPTCCISTFYRTGLLLLLLLLLPAQVAHEPGSKAAVAGGGAASHLRPRQAPGLPGSE